MKKKLGIFLLSMLFVFAPATTADASNGVEINDNKNGTVTVTYSGSDMGKIAVTVKKDGANNQYNYFIDDSSVAVDIPLTSGNGIYKVSVLKHIQDSKYSPLSSEEVQLELEDSNAAFLTSNEMLQWNAKNAAIKKANKLVKKQKNQNGKAKALYKYLVKNYHYDYDKYADNSSGKLAYYTPDINDTYKTKKGICYDMSALTASMMRSVGIKTKMVTGYPKSEYFNGSQYHAWNKYYVNGKWTIIDITCDMCLYEQGMAYSKLKMKKKASQYSNVRYEW